MTKQQLFDLITGCHFVDLNQHVGGTKGCVIFTYEGIQQVIDRVVNECAQKLENDGMVEVAMELKQHFGV